MEREFIMTREFDRLWKELNCNDDDLKSLQEELLVKPNVGDLIQGTGGIRKYRIPMEGRGKRGGARVCYLDIPKKKHLFLLMAYAKNEKSDLSKDECKLLKQLSTVLKRTAFQEEEMKT